MTTPLDGLVAYWKLDESSFGAIRIDSTGRGNDLTPLNFDQGSQPGKISLAARLDQHLEAQFLSRPSTADLRCSNQSITMSAWFNPVSVPGSIISKWDSMEYLLQVNADLTVTFQVYNQSSASVRSVTSPNTAVLNQWNFVICGMTAAFNPTIWIRVNNGAVPNAKVGAAALVDGTADFIIGLAFTGGIDEVGFWKTDGLNSSLPTDIWNNSRGLSYPFATIPAGSGTLIALGQLIVTTAGIPVALNNHQFNAKGGRLRCHAFFIQALPTNSGRLYVGDGRLSTATGVGMIAVIPPPTAAQLGQVTSNLAYAPDSFDLSTLFLDADNAGEGALITAVIG